MLDYQPTFILFFYLAKNVTQSKRNKPVRKVSYYIANQSIIEVGKRLIQAQELVPHDDWAYWLKENFNLKYTAATRFMQIAERFGNVPTSEHLTTSQMFVLLSLPEADTEKFIAEKAAEGNPADKMTIKQLREEIKHWNR